MGLQLSRCVYPDARKKAIFGALGKHLGEAFWDLARHKQVEVEDGQLMSDHVHMCPSIPPKIAVASVIGWIHVRSAPLARQAQHVRITTQLETQKKAPALLLVV